MGALLAPDEEPAIEIREGGGPFVVVCEHASNRIPRSVGTLGLSRDDLDRHIAWDPGAAEVAKRLADRLDGALLLQRYSRLVIDCNRAPDLADAVTPLSEETEDTRQCRTQRRRQGRADRRRMGAVPCGA